jgi:hypothetical protein
MKDKFIKVRVLPNSKHESVGKMSDGRIKVKISKSPEGGKANEQLVEVLGKYLGKDSQKIKIIKGQQSKDKLIKIID